MGAAVAGALRSRFIPTAASQPDVLMVSGMCDAPEVDLLATQQLHVLLTWPAGGGRPNQQDVTGGFRGDISRGDYSSQLSRHHWG